MNKTQQAHQFSLATWASRFQEQKASGLTVKVWCEQNNISIHTYHYWKHLVKQEYLESVLPTALPDIVPITPPSLSTFSSNSNESRDSRNLLGSNTIRIELPGIFICLDSPASIEMAVNILKAVHYV